MFQKEVTLVNSLLNLQRKIVGVKLISSQEEFEQDNSKDCLAPIPYCVAVRSAMSGYSLKFSREFSGCAGSTRALGLAPASPDFYTGEAGYSLGLFKSCEIAAQAAWNLPVCTIKTYGVTVKPLEHFEQSPDVVLIVSSPFNCMRILQGYTYHYGPYKAFCASGNQAVCVESTVFPLNTGQPNLSLLCSGTRYLAKWRENEMMLGIPVAKFKNTVDGILQTVNGVEDDKRKQEIAANLSRIDFSPEIVIQYGSAYYLR